MITAKNESNTNYTPVPSGTFVARCYSMIQLGTHEETYMGVLKELNKVRITWEMPLELKVFKEGEEEKPYSISKELTLSMFEKANLRKLLEGWRGKGFTDEEAEAFDISVLLGKPCMISIIHKTSKTTGKIYADISSVTTLPKGVTCPPQINDTFEFSFEEFDAAKLDKMPDWLKEKITSSQEYNNLINPQSIETPSGGSDEPVDDLPFLYSPNQFKFNL